MLTDLPPSPPPDPGRTGPATAADVMIRFPKVHGPATTVGELTRLFTDDHVQCAVLTEADGRLITVIDRAEVPPGLAPGQPARTLGRRTGRTVTLETGLASLLELLATSGRRRLAVLDGDGRLAGLICLNRRGNGFCSDADVEARAAERRAAAPPRPDGCQS